MLPSIGEYVEQLGHSCMVCREMENLPKDKFKFHYWESCYICSLNICKLIFLFFIDLYFIYTEEIYTVK